MEEADVMELNETAEAALAHRSLGEDGDGLRVYEVGYHIVPSVAEVEVEAAVGTVRGEIEKIGGSFVAEGAPALMKLAYPMTTRENGKNVEHDRGYFGWIKFEAQSDKVAALDLALKADKQILRFIVFRTVREETRARMKIPTLREVKRTDVIRAAPRRVEEAAAPVSEEDLEKAIEGLTIE